MDFARSSPVSVFVDGFVELAKQVAHCSRRDVSVLPKQRVSENAKAQQLANDEAKPETKGERRSVDPTSRQP